WEGLIAKDAQAPYQPGKRSAAWLKFKCGHEQEFVIGGYTEPRGERGYFGALLLGYYANGELQFAGKVGAGFDNRELRELHKQMKTVETAACPFVDPASIHERTAHWLRPKL